ncbi:MAG: hypothetical protein FJW14_08755 [Acidimicrobiia bacterium]|nr:hypothetical protein [Acidimicrobiia bacterium]
MIVALSLLVALQQVLLDRIVANVDGVAITQTDLNAAIALGVIQEPALERLVERQLVLAEVARFAPPDPPAAAIDTEVAAMTARAGGRLAAVMDATGVDETRIREMARDTLRIQAYAAQRFGPAGLGSPETAQWLKDLRGRAKVTIRN